MKSTVSGIFGRPVTLSQPRGADYAHRITTGQSTFSDLPRALKYNVNVLRQITEVGKRKEKKTYVVLSHPRKLINGSTLNQQPCAFFPLGF